MRKAQKIISILLTFLMVSVFVTGCGDDNTTPPKTLDISTKIGDIVTVSLKSENLELVATGTESIYDFQAIDENGNIVLSGQFVDRETYDYYSHTLTEGVAKDDVTTIEGKHANYTVIMQGASNNYCILGLLDDEKSVMMYSFCDYETTSNMLTKLSFK